MKAMLLLCILLLVAGAIVVSGCAQQGTGTLANGAGSGNGGQAGGTDEQEIAQGPPLPPE